MSSNHLYYHLKPYLPWRLRMAVRRMVAKRRRREFNDVWPINEAAGQPPEGWPGWPDGKKFAFVLTHDVESPTGLANCRRLMQLEMKLGFRSSFNFIPEGGYAVPREMREELVENGFEVGVHDLHHDGRLFWTRSDFSRDAKWINHYLRDWKATGFRSGFMLRNLDWLHDLDIRYDASTFDTDPFEPQPEGAGTIFPFWVERERRQDDAKTGQQDRSQLSVVNGPSASSPLSVVGGHSSPGYVELPYTLPQDSTLFLLLQERSPEIWFRKLDWVAEHGGMALLNVHPDYLQFENHPSSRTYPHEFYERFLREVKCRYKELYWHVLPAQAAAHLVQHSGGCTSRYGRLDGRRTGGHPIPGGKPSLTTLPGALPGYDSIFGDRPFAGSEIGALLSDGAERNRSLELQSPVLERVIKVDRPLLDKRVAVVLFSYYPSDPRPRRAAETLARQGAEVDFLCLRENPGQAKRERNNGLNVFRFPLKRRRGGKLAYLLQYSTFILLSFAFLARRSLTRRYQLVHVHNMPDILVFSALVPKLLGAKVILDLHDPMPELMMTIFRLPQESLPVRFLKLMEKWSIRFADLVLTPNLAFRKLFTSRSCPPGKIHIVMNTPNEETFRFKPVASVTRTGDRAKPLVILYHGSLVSRHGLDLAIDALEIVRKAIPKAALVICGQSTPYFEGVMNSVRERGLEDAVRYLGMRNRRQIVEAIEQCDLGVIPNRRSTFTEINMPTRIFEYLTLGKPVLAPRTQGIRDYFGEHDLVFFEPDNVTDLACQIEFVAFHPEETNAIVDRGQAIYQRHRWSQERQKFTELVQGLLGSVFSRTDVPEEAVFDGKL